ncbi:hydrogenase small subunit [Escherichia coli]|nr:hydrogenase small subunit [Escherichia coli]
MTGDNTLIHSHGINRRDFMKLCAALAATMGLSSKAAAEMAESVTNPQRPPVIWIGAQECTGCTESLLRATHPTVENLVLETISLEYHEVLSAAFGHQVEENKHNALEKYKGQYVLVVDGSIPLKDNGIYCMVAGEPIVDHIRKAAEGAAAIIAIGSCSAWGGVAALELTQLAQSACKKFYRAKPLSIFLAAAEPAQLPGDRCAHHHLWQTAETG